MSTLSAIGNTPLVELTNLNNKKPRVRIFLKLEGCKSRWFDQGSACLIYDSKNGRIRTTYQK